MILKCESADYEQDVLEVSNRIQKALLDNLELETSIGISEPAMLSNFKDAYEEACEALNSGIIWRKTHRSP